MMFFASQKYQKIIDNIIITLINYKKHKSSKTCVKKEP